MLLSTGLDQAAILHGPARNENEMRLEFISELNQKKKMMKATGQELLHEDEYTLEFDQECGEAIVFEFDEKGILTKIYS